MVINDADFFLSHRLPIALGAKSEGYDVSIATNKSDSSSTITRLGFHHIELPLSRSGMNLLAELKTIYAMYKLLKNQKPDLIHLVTIKPVIYGGILARLLKIPAVVSAISGLGFLFSEHSEFSRRSMKKFAAAIYAQALAHKNQHIIFQNTNDAAQLNPDYKLNSTLIPGSGVNLTEFECLPEPSGRPIVVMASRLLKDKGVLDFVAAAELLSQQNIDVEMVLAGEPDPENPESITTEQFRQWESNENLTCLGYCNNISELFSQSSVVALPSYYKEGLPKVLIEAAACGRPVITTDLPGCRDAIIANKTGLLIPAKNPEALAKAIEYLISEPELRKNMGTAAREHAVSTFSIDDVVTKHLNIYSNLLFSTQPKAVTLS